MVHSCPDLSLYSDFSQVFLLDVDVQKLLFELFSCYLICFVLILENIGLAELQKGEVGGGEREREKEKKMHHFLSARFLCIAVTEKPYQSMVRMHFRFVLKKPEKFEAPVP